MRRKDKDLTDIKALEDIIRRSLVCRLAMSDNGMPYVIPLNFGYQNGSLYFHAATEGKKLDILRKNRQVCVEFDLDLEVVRGQQACNWGMKFRSVIAFGEASILDGFEEKEAGLRIIMQQYAGDESFQFSANAVQKTAVIKVDINSISGKVAGYERDNPEE